MTVAEVGSGQVPVFPTFKGFRKETDKEMSGAAKSASGIFGSVFSKAGTDSGKNFGSSFSVSAKASTAGALKSLSADVAKSARDVSASRLKEQDATGRVRVAESQLAEARKKYAADSSQVVRAEERLATVQRTHVGALAAVVSSTEKLTAAQRKLAQASSESAASAEKSGGAFGRLPGIFNRAGTESSTAFGSSFKSGVGQIFSGAFLANVATTALSKAGQLLGDAASAGLQYGLQGVNLASELEQSTGAVEAVFKDQAASILGYANEAATAVGLSRSSYQKYATVVGAQLKNLRLPIDQVSGKTNELITLGADLAAQFGGPTADAVGALSSLLRGERDPIERYGVGLKQADIDARKAALGLSDLTGEADKRADITATLGLLWEQTADAQGTFFRETDTYAHKQQVLNAQLEESQTRLGEALMPTASEMLDFATTDLLPVLEGVIATVGPKVAESLKEAAPEIKEALTAIADAVPDAIELAGKLAPIVSASIKGDLKMLTDGVAAYETAKGFFADYLPKWAAGKVSVEESWDGFFRWWDVAWDGAAETTRAKTGEVSAAVKSSSEQASSDWDWNTVFNPGDTSAFDAGLGAGDNYGLGLTEKQPLVQEAGSQLGVAAGYGARDGSAGMYGAGVDAATGFGDGITAQKGYALAAAEDLAGGVIGKMKSTLDINSPSRVMREMGHNTVDGYVLGLDDRQASSLAAIQALVAMPAGSSAMSAPSVASAPAYGSAGGGAQVQMDVHPAPGMDEATFARKVAYKLESVLDSVH